MFIEELPAFEETAHGSEDGRRRVITEKRRVKALISKASRDIPDTDLADLRAALPDMKTVTKRPEPSVV